MEMLDYFLIVSSQASRQAFILLMSPFFWDSKYLKMDMTIILTLSNESGFFLVALTLNYYILFWKEFDVKNSMKEKASLFILNSWPKVV